MKTRIITAIVLSLTLMGFPFTNCRARAELLNGGFETAGTNFIFQVDSNASILTNTEAANWKLAGVGPQPDGRFGVAARTKTNTPASGFFTESDFGYTFPNVNSSGSTNTAHSGQAALRAFGPFTNSCCEGAGAYQVITNTISQAVSNNQIWVMSGYGLNWSDDPMTDLGVGVENFGVIQIAFLDAAGHSLETFDGPHLGTNTPVNQWISCTVTAIAPEGATQVGIYALHVGMSGALGSIFWDDISVTNIGVAAAPTHPTLEPAAIRIGNQICWPTIVNSSYRPQYSDDNVVWVNILPANAAQQLLPGDGTTNCIFSISHKFYRVLQQPGTVASLLNSGFEAGTTIQADNWVQFSNGYRTGTSDSLFGITAHSGGFSMKTFGPFGTNVDASGAYQDLPASASQNWRLTGYCLNWQNDKLSGPDGFGVAQLQFLDSLNGVIATVEGSHFGTDVPFPLDTWQFFEVDATNAPAGTAKVRAQVLHMGQAGDSGSVWWDDLAIYQAIGSSSANAATVQPAVQIYWPTAPPSNSLMYQAQSITNLVFTNLPAVNVLINAGFEADAVSNAANTTSISGWTAANGGTKFTSSYPNPTHSGLGALRMTAGGSVPIAWQIFPASPGQVWDFRGYLLQTDSSPLNGSAFALLKIVWLDSSSVTLQPVTGDVNVIGTAVMGTFAGIESTHVTSGSALNTWLFREARGTAPVNCTQVQVLPILVSAGSSGTIRFDDLVLSQGGTSFGWKNFDPVFPGNGNTNQTFNPIGSNQQKFYRITTP